MSDIDRITKNHSTVKKYALILATFWTLLVVALIAWNSWEQTQYARELIKNEARTHLSKDQAFRLWVAEHGGVYVPPTDRTPPNPYLAHIPDRDIETTTGKKLTLIDPAYMLRQLMEDYSKKYGIRGHLTSLNPLRPENAPEEWERAALESFEANKAEIDEFTEIDNFVEIDGNPHLRLIRPLFVEEPCLRCHASQGYKVGDIRGGLSISLPAKAFFAHSRAETREYALAFGILWLLGLIALVSGARHVQRRVNERDRAEQAFRENALQFSTVLENSRDILYQFNLTSGTFDYVSPSLEKLVGIPVKDFIEGGVELAISLVHPEDKVEVQNHIDHLLNRTIEDDMIPAIEYRFKHPTLGWRWFSDNRTVVYDDNDTPKLIVGSSRDITDSKLAEKKIEDSEKKIRDWLENSPICTKVVDLDLNLQFMSAAGVKSLMIEDVNQLYGKPYPFDFYPASFRNTMTGNLEKVKETSEVITQEAAVVDIDGNELWFHSTLVPVNDDDGQLDYILVLSMETTDRVQAQEALRESEERFREIVEGTSDLITVINAQGEFTYANYVSEQILGVASDQCQGLIAFDFVHPDDQKATKEWFDRCLAASVEEASFENRQINRKTGTATSMLWTCRFIYDNNGKIQKVFGIARDITERKQVEIELRNRERTLLESQEVAHIGSYSLDITAGRWTCSKVMDRIFGLEPNKDPNHTIEDWVSIIHPDWTQTMADYLTHDVLKKRGRFDKEYKIVRKSDGVQRWVHGLGELELNSAGEPVTMIGTIQDITERKLAEAAQFESENKYRTLFEQSADAVLIIEGNKFVDCNPATVKMLGYKDKSELLATHPSKLSPETQPDGRDSYEKANEMMSIAFAKGSHRFEWDHMRQNGEVFPVEVLLTAVPLGERDFLHVVWRDITERKLAEEKIEKQQYYLTKGQEIGSIGTWELDLISNKLIWTDETYRIFGVPIGTELNYEIFIEQVHPDDTKYVSEEFMAAIAGGPYDIEHRLIVDGKVKWVREKAEFLRNEEGKVISAIGFAQDITKHKQAEEALRESERSLIKVQEVANVGFLKWNLASDEIFLSDTLIDLYGLDSGENRKTPEFIAAVVHPDDIEQARKNLEAIKEGKNPQNIDHRVLRPDGTVIWVHAQHELIYDSKGQSESLLGTVVDITERKRAEEAIRESEEKFRTYISNAPDAIFVTDAEGRYVEVNRAACELTGYTEAELTSMAISDIVDPASVGESLAGFNDLKKTGTRKSEVWLKRNNGSVVLTSMDAVALSENRFMAFCSDITETKRLQALESRAERLETAGTIAGQVAHDFNNLLAPLMAYPDYIRDELPENHAVHGYLDSIENAAIKMTEINQDLLTMGRRGHYNQEVLNLNLLIAQTVKEMQSQSPTMTFETDLDEQLMNISGGAAQIHRMLTNLLTNAQDATQDTGLVKVKSENYYADDTSVAFGRVPRGEYVKLSIIDNGCGIPDDLTQKILDPFFTTKTADKKRGSGLGLSVVDAVMKDHNGYLDMNSRIGHGTSFYLYFPVTREETKDDERDQLAGGNETVLIVDDDDIQREVSSELLKRLGYKVSAVENGEQAVEFIKENQPDLIILDMVMPGGIDGAETYSQILKINRNQKAIILSGYSESDRVAEAQRLGAGAFVRKPITRDVIAVAVRTELDRKGQAISS